MKRVQGKAFEEKVANAVKYAHTVRGVGQKCTTESVLKLFNLSSSYSKLFTAITGKEDGVEALCKEVIDGAREINRNLANKPSVTSEVNIFDLMPETPQTEEPKPCVQDSQKDIDLERIHNEYREEMLKYNLDIEKAYKTTRFNVVATECLYRLVSARPKESSSTLASKAVEIAEKFTQLLDKE